MVKYIFLVILSIFLLFGNYNFTDVSQAISYYGAIIFPASPFLGGFVFILAFFTFLFYGEVKKIYVRYGKNIKIKETFN